MSEIDVTKCVHYHDGLCMCNPILNDGGVLGYEECKKISNRCIRLTGQLLQAKNNLECAELRNKYDKEKFDSELQQLKVENEELKETKKTLNDIIKILSQRIDDCKKLIGTKDWISIKLDDTILTMYPQLKDLSIKLWAVPLEDQTKENCPQFSLTAHPKMMKE